MNARTSVITDWRTREEDLPVVAPGEEYEIVIATQLFVVLNWILVRDLMLARLQIGTVAVPFELEHEEDSVRRYRPNRLDSDDLKNLLVATGAAIATPHSIAISPDLEVRLILRNDGTLPAKARGALIVQEELP